MDEKKTINGKLKIKRELTNVHVKKYCKKKCIESQQLNSSMQDDSTEKMKNKQVKENNAKRKRAMAKKRLRFREKKRLKNLFIKGFHIFHFCRVILSTHGFFFLT